MTIDAADGAAGADANVIAGTDSGLGGRVGHPEIVWANSPTWPLAPGWPPSGSGLADAPTLLGS